MDRPPGAGYIRSVIRSRNLLACLLCLVGMVAFPAAALAQTAGDTEYGGVAAANATSPPATPTPPASGTAGETTQSTTPATARPSTAQVASETASGTLPFTGRDILLMLVAGIGLVGLGVVLRSATRRAPAGA
jgi:hypothetical protein